MLKDAHGPEEEGGGEEYAAYHQGGENGQEASRTNVEPAAK